MDMVCLRIISVDTLHKGDIEDDDNNNNNNNNLLLLLLLLWTTGYKGVDWMNVAYDRYVQMAIFWECVSELSCSIKFAEYFDWVRGS
jgi:hypothetical protein